ncbi:glycoside hydrolase, partial [Aspergillus heteromorphus CBS 117.55]
MWSKLLTVTAAVASLTPFVSAFDAEAKNNVAIYYGQGYDQKRLSHFCAETSLDIINLGFIDIFPDQGPAGWPGSDFGNQCDGTTYQVGSVSTDLLKGCYQLIEDIPICQAAGKKVLLSLGGSTPTNQQILSNSSAVNFADFLWGAFGPKTDEWVNNNGPRPFGDVVVDGFDFDIEHNGGFGYAVMINHFRQLFKQAPDQTFYISGAPQCQIPDKQLADAITNSVFDFIWVQFYNTDGCAAIDYDFVSDVSTGFNFDSWVSFINGGKSRNAKLYMGLPASASAANAGFYITPAEASILATKYMGLYPDTFGGMMVWEATASDENSVDGVSFAGAMKDILLELDPLPVTTSSSVAVASSTPVPSTTAVPSSVLTTSSSVVSSSTLSAVTSSTIVVPTSPVSASTVVAPSTPVLSSTSSATSSPVVVSSSVSVPAISLTTSVHSTTPVLSSLSIVSSSSVVASSPVVSIAPAITTSSISFSPSPVVASSSPVALSSSVSSSSPAVPSSSVVSSVSVASSAIATSGIPFSSSSSVVPVSPIASSSSVVSGSPPPSSPASS